MDEVFDLKSRNQWLRRRIVAILQQIAKTMFGDSINRSATFLLFYFMHVFLSKVKKVKVHSALHGVSDLRSVTCHIG